MLVQFSEVPMPNVLPRKVLKLKKKTAFDAQLFLQSVGASRRVEEFRKKQAIFSQGEPADSVMYVQEGSVKLTVVNESGKEAVVAMFPTPGRRPTYLRAEVRSTGLPRTGPRRLSRSFAGG
jgi:CRP-like cAMP-binding protein